MAVVFDSLPLCRSTFRKRSEDLSRLNFREKLSISRRFYETTASKDLSNQFPKFLRTGERCEERVACKMFTELAKFDRRRANYNTCSPSTDRSAERRANSRNLIYRRQINTAAKVSLARRLPNPSTNYSMNFVLSVNRCSRFYGMISRQLTQKSTLYNARFRLHFIREVSNVYEQIANG